MKMLDIMPEQVREWVTWMKDRGASPVTVQYSKSTVLNAIFTTALADEIIGIHPSHGVKIPPNPEKPRRIITPAQFDHLYQVLLDADAQLLVETDIESGLRWGELTELRVRDLDFETCILTVSRAVVELTREEHPTGGRFLVKDYPEIWDPARADFQVVKERLGHANISTTEKYLHSLPTADETALDALSRIRNPVPRTP